MAGVALRQIRAIIAVCEEGSFTRAAARENATQSGISQHVAAAERTLGVKLFERSAAGVKPTPAGQRYYKRCIEAVGQLANANEEVRGFASRVTGDLRIGLIPTLTRAALAPTLEQFVPRYPDVRLHIVEGYSGWLTDMVLDGRARLRGGADLRGPRRPEIAADRARPRDAGVERQARLEAARAGAAEGLRAAEDHPARPHQRPPPQHRGLFPDPRRRSRRHDRDGRHDQHAAIRRCAPTGWRSCPG